jgi:hypothetical protein
MPHVQIISSPPIHSTPHIAAASFTHGQSPWNSALRVIRLSNRLLTDISRFTSKQCSESDTELLGTFFSESYQRWYSESREFISRVLPARLPEFEFLYCVGLKRKTITRKMYSIRDWLLEVRKPEKHVTIARNDNLSNVAFKRFCYQYRIVKSVESYFKSSSFGMDLAVIGFDNETRDLYSEQEYIQFLTSAATFFIASKDLLFNGPESSRFREILLESFEKKNIVIDV